MEAKIENIDAEIAKLRADLGARAERRQADAKSRELALLRAVQASAAKHGEDSVVGLLADRGWAVLRKPHPAVYRAYADRQLAATPQNPVTTEDMMQFVRPCVDSDLAAWDALLAVEPAVLTRAADACMKLAGHRREGFLG